MYSVADKMPESGNWWINDNKRKVNPDQTVMFE